MRIQLVRGVGFPAQRRTAQRGATQRKMDPRLRIIGTQHVMLDFVEGYLPPKKFCNRLLPRALRPSNGLDGRNRIVIHHQLERGGIVEIDQERNLLAQVPFLKIGLGNAAQLIQIAFKFAWRGLEPRVIHQPTFIALGKDLCKEGVRVIEIRRLPADSQPQKKCHGCFAHHSLILRIFPNAKSNLIWRFLADRNGISGRTPQHALNPIPQFGNGSPLRHAFLPIECLT